VYKRQLTGYAPLTDEFIDRLTDHVVAGLSGSTNGSEIRHEHE
jgi:hypothetical protein